MEKNSEEYSFLWFTMAHLHTKYMELINSLPTGIIIQIGEIQALAGEIINLRIGIKQQI